MNAETPCLIDTTKVRQFPVLVHMPPVFELRTVPQSKQGRHTSKQPLHRCGRRPKNFEGHDSWFIGQ